MIETLIYVIISAAFFVPIEKHMGFNHRAIVAALIWPLWIFIAVLLGLAFLSTWMEFRK